MNKNVLKLNHINDFLYIYVQMITLIVQLQTNNDLNWEYFGQNKVSVTNLTKTHGLITLIL